MLRTRKVPEELLDVITYELIKDPVIAEDNVTYGRANILDWFAQCKARNEPITSPMTRSEIGETLRPNYPIQRSLEVFQNSADSTSSAPESEAPSIAQLAKVFEVIDPIRDLLASIKWQPPAIVVLGNEKSGKSSLLERLAMIPIFPKAKQICTRMAIHVRLRRGPAKPPLVEVYDKVAGAVLRDMVIPMEKGNEYVNDAMERILMAENDGVIRGICNRKMLVLHVSSPSAPNLDLVDLPGLVSTFVRGEPENMQALTRELVENYIKENSTHSMYLVTIPATSATNQSLAMEVVQRYKLQSRTIGVLTKSDLYATIADDEIEKADNVRELCEKVYQKSSDVCPLPTYGYVATMNKPIRDGQFNTNYGALTFQAEREREWFVNMGFSEIVESGHASMGALVNRLSSVYHNYMRHTWAPLTILRLERERVSISQREQALGLPRADAFILPGQSSEDGTVPIEQVATMATELTIQMFKNQRTVIIDRICSLILKNFQSAIRSESVSKNCSPADAIDLQRQAKVQIEHHCTSALDYLQKFLLNEIKVILSSDKTSFCLHRFSNLIDAILERSALSLDQWRQDTETTMLNYVAMAFQNLPINPYLSIKYSFDGPEPMVKFSFDSSSLSDVLPHVMVLRLSALITDLLGSTVATVAHGLPDSSWIENCASERKAMIKTVHMIEVAEAELMQVLFISPSDMENFIGAGSKEGFPDHSHPPPPPQMVSPQQQQQQQQQLQQQQQQSQHPLTRAAMPMPMPMPSTVPGLSRAPGGGPPPPPSGSNINSNSNDNFSVTSDKTSHSNKYALQMNANSSTLGMSSGGSVNGNSSNNNNMDESVSSKSYTPMKNYSEHGRDEAQSQNSYRTPSASNYNGNNSSMLSQSSHHNTNTNTTPVHMQSNSNSSTGGSTGGGGMSTPNQPPAHFTGTTPYAGLHLSSSFSNNNSNSSDQLSSYDMSSNPTPANTPNHASSSGSGLGTPGGSMNRLGSYGSLSKEIMLASSSSYGITSSPSTSTSSYNMPSTLPSLSQSTNGKDSTSAAANMSGMSSSYEPSSSAGKAASAASSSMIRLMMERGTTVDGNSSTSSISNTLSGTSTGTGTSSMPGGVSGSSGGGSMHGNSPHTGGMSYGGGIGTGTGGMSYGSYASAMGSGGGMGVSGSSSMAPSSSTTSIMSSSLNRTTRFDANGAPMYDGSGSSSGVSATTRYENQSMDISRSSAYSQQSANPSVPSSHILQNTAVTQSRYVPSGAVPGSGSLSSSYTMSSTSSGAMSPHSSTSDSQSQSSSANANANAWTPGAGAGQSSISSGGGGGGGGAPQWNPSGPYNPSTAPGSLASTTRITSTKIIAPGAPPAPGGNNTTTRWTNPQAE
eukprot:gene9012-18658_t